METREILRKLCREAKYWTELRFHHRKSRTLGVKKGEVSDMASKTYSGVGIRVLVDGTWGFAATSDLSEDALKNALALAEAMAKEISSVKKNKIELPSVGSLAKGDFFEAGYQELDEMPIAEKFAQVQAAEAKLTTASSKIDAASCRYSELLEDKIILTSDGADAHVKIPITEFRLLAFSSDGDKSSLGMESVGAEGNWQCMFRNHKLDEMVDEAAKYSVDLLSAPQAKGGKKKVILSPAMVGLLSHEAIGHTVEADFVNSGSVAAGKLGEMVASPLVTMCDSGHSEHIKGASGTLQVDDEGVLTKRTEIIKDGKLTSYLHNRESAAQHGVAPTGNARAWVYSDEPLIRMRNTYIEPGKDNLEDLITGVEDGFFIDGPGGGQADATAEFMFGAQKVRKITDGKLGEIVQKMSVSGNAFEVLKSVDGVSKEFRWDLGAGHCGKGQPAKVDAGGPYVRCEMTIGGAQ